MKTQAMEIVLEPDKGVQPLVTGGQEPKSVISGSLRGPAFWFGFVLFFSLKAIVPTTKRS